MEHDYLPVSWEEYHSLAQKLASSILSHPKRDQEIIAISRGGLTLGHMLSDLLRLPIATITIQSYTDIQTQGSIRVTGKLHTSIAGKRILLVDDVADSGRTLIRARTYLKKFHPKDISTVTMFYKPRSVVRPDYFAQKTTKWILFPYEPTEMIFLITKSLEKSGKTKAHIQKFLENLNYTDEQIRFVRENHYSK
ncbi:MAG: phosphoribosyltransferase family protein [bacterium]|nr:phosphoribosyltransferase family protein [bacterium]